MDFGSSRSDRRERAATRAVLRALASALANTQKVRRIALRSDDPSAKEPPPQRVITWTLADPDEIDRLKQKYRDRGWDTEGGQSQSAAATS